MAKILDNWPYRDVTHFLGEKSFEFYEDLEHFQCWVKLRDNGEPERFVEIKFTQGFYTSKALNKMIRQPDTSAKLFFCCIRINIAVCRLF